MQGTSRARQRIMLCLRARPRLQGGRRRTRLHADEREVGRRADERAKATCGQAAQKLLVQRQRLALVVLDRLLVDDAKDTEARGGVGGLAQQPRGEAFVQAADACARAHARL
jgi:hypothetical protein